MSKLALWMPNSVTDSLLHEGEGRRMVDFQKRLRAIDPRLSLVLVDERTDELRQGFWHVVRRNDDGTTAWFEISNPDGTYREPDEGVLEELRRTDANRTDLPLERARRREAARRKKAHDQALAADERRGRLAEEMAYAFRVQHAFPNGTVGRKK